MDKTKRLAFLDVLRAIAAMSVLTQHAFETLPHFVEITINYFQFGVFGVMLFFLCSGFIIPTSIEKSNIKAFWTGRVFRLFPLYWFSLILALFLVPHPPFKILVADIFMMGKVFGNPTLGLYWTLTLELFFYVTITVLFATRLICHSVVIAITALILATINGVFIGKFFGIAFYFASFFIGTVFFRYHTKDITLTTTVKVLFVAMTCILTITTACLWGKDNPALLGTHSFVPVTTAWIFAYLVFFCGLLLREVRFPVFAVYLGKISYSIYLMQALAILVVPKEWIFVSTIFFASITYHAIEEPFIRIGRTITAYNLYRKHNA
jgi:peptidoglycan/LPS O-acetylase OafA/YrhL